MGHEPPFQVSVERVGGTHIVRPVGELDTSTAPRFEAILGTLHGRVIIDCSAVTLLDGRALGVVARAHRANGGIRLRDLSPACRRVVDAVGMGGLVVLEQR
jgi:anti-anti-sigma factor